MSDRSANGIHAEEPGTAGRGGTRRRQGLSAPRARLVERHGPAHTNRRTLSKVLVGERERRLYVLTPDQIEYIESRGNYVEFHAGGLPFISRDSLKRLSRLLAAEGYLRIQRTMLLNLRSILYAQRIGHGRFEFTLSSGARLCSGARFRIDILRVLPLSRVQHDSDA
jgi:DNA-binding LytR/AlgR family response regulator